MIQEIIQTVLTPIHNLGTMVAGSDPTAKGIFSVAIFGMVIAFGRNLPRLIWFKIKRTFTSSITVYFDPDRNNIAEKRIYEDLSAFIAKKTKSRIFEIIQNPERAKKDEEGYYPSTLTVGTGNNRGFFFNEGKIYFFSKVTERASQGDAETQGGQVNKLTVSAFTKDSKFFLKLIPNQSKRFEKHKSRHFFTPNTQTTNRNGWMQGVTLEKAAYLFIDKEVEDKIKEKVTWFLNNEDWYKKRGLSYKLNIVLYGPPGVGKTSLTRYVADLFDKGICTMNALQISSSSFATLIESSADRDSIVSIQDFDTCPAFLKRKSESKSLVDVEGTQSAFNPLTESINPRSLNTLDLTTVLNTFQGDIPLNGVITVFTTNHIEKIDPAFLRPGRTDLLLEIKPLTILEIQRFYNYYYENEEVLGDEFQNLEIPGAYLHGYFIDHSHDPEAFKEKLLAYKGN